MNKRDIVLSEIKLTSTEPKKEDKKNKKYKVLDSVIGPSFPSLYLDTKRVPDLKGKEVGDEITIIAKCKISSHSIYENSFKENSSCENFSLDIKEMGIA